jgi:hypothetical protein
MILHARIADPEARDLWSAGEWSANKKLTIRSDHFRFARYPGGSANRFYQAVSRH